MNKSIKYIFIISLIFFSCAHDSKTLSVSQLFSDGAILQRNTKIAIWGKSNPNKIVEIQSEWAENISVNSGLNGKWIGYLKTPEGGGPYSITINCDEETLNITDVLIGEVWLASGQSNMEMPLKGWLPNDPIDNSDVEIKKADYPNIRMFTVKKNASAISQDKLNGKWEKTSPKTAENFSAVAYFFSRELHNKLNVPIGIIHSSWGGTPAEAWTSERKLKELDLFLESLDKIKSSASQKVIDGWFNQWPKQKIPGDDNDKWKNLQFNDSEISNIEYEDSSWNKKILPGRFDTFVFGDFDGVIWFRKTFEVVDLRTDYQLYIGAVDDMDKIFINGNYIGGFSGYGFWNKERVIDIPKSILRKGKNFIAIRAIDTGGPGTFKGPMIISNNMDESISIEGDWKYMPIAEIYKNQFITYEVNTDLNLRPKFPKLNQNSPTMLFNGMIHPIIPYSIAGVIWYQGESNVGRHEQYNYLFPGMIEDWRNRWGKDFPFYYVQIAPFTYNQDPTQQISQYLRESQRKTLEVRKTGMVVTLDIGDLKNIHPSNKLDVGKRLSRLALFNDYGFDLIPSSPVYINSEIIKNKLKLNFDNVGLGLINQTKLTNEFEISGSNRQYYKADVLVNKNYLLVSSVHVNNPKYIRYAWSDISKATLFNSEGLPASSFIDELK